MALVKTGTPVVGYASLTNGAPGPTSFALQVTMGGASAYTLAATERLYITNITISTNDAAAPLVTIDTGGTTPTKLTRVYASPTSPPSPEAIPPGVCRGLFGVAPRASAPAVTLGKTVEVVIAGYVGRA